MCKQYFPRENPTDFIAPEPVRIGSPARELEIRDIVAGEEWRFTKDKPEFHESGRVYRKQVLATNSKQTRTVEVDIDNPDEIVRVM